MKKKIVAIVPVRKGSKRIKNKNFKNFAGSNLFEIKLKSLKRVALIDEIIVSTDSEIAIKIIQRSKFTRVKVCLAALLVSFLSNNFNILDNIKVTFNINDCTFIEN